MQLIYRGQAFNYSPSTAPSTPGATGIYRTLFYRGASYRCQLATMQPTQLPKVINWRFASEVPKQYLKPAH